MEHKKGVILCLIGGVLMILGSVVGSIGFLGKILSYLGPYVGQEAQQVISMILTIFTFTALGGGISVIIGALIAGYSSDRLGRIIAGLGIGIGLIGLIIILITNLIEGISLNEIVDILLATFNGLYGLFGVILSILGRMKLKD
ncbi:MAG: hypothetical protein KGD63_03655 [Candidatus Lokiarchaeota archaeon]|nr:hypothetical protein [Candidatus Lokiarchaeota archaeon]